MSIFTGTFTARTTDTDAGDSTSWRDTPSSDAIAEAAARLEGLRDKALRRRKLVRAAEFQDVLDLIRQDFR